MNRHLIHRRSRQRKRKGSALIEFALSFGILVPIFLGTFQFGVAFQHYNELTSAVRAGARYASYRTYDSSTSTPSAGYVAAIRNVVVYGNPGGGDSPIVPGLLPSHVTVEIGMISGIPGTVTVAIKDYPLNVLFAQWNLQKPASTFPYTGRYAPEPET
jgi:hypothetical protein